MKIEAEVTAVEKRTYGVGYTATLKSKTQNLLTLWIDTDNPQSFPLGATFDIDVTIREDQ